MTPDSLAKKIEALLFSEGEPQSIKRLANILEVGTADIESALQHLAASLNGRGIAIIKTETEVGLAVSPTESEEISALHAKELEKDIGDAGLEVLAILLYRGPSTRADIDYIRGVNSSFTIRAMLARSLIERIKNPNDSREFVYRPTVELLAHLGVKEGSELPDRDTIGAELAEFEKGKHHATNQSESIESGNTEIAA